MRNTSPPDGGASRRLASPTRIPPATPDPGSAPQGSSNPQPSRPDSAGPSHISGSSKPGDRPAAGTPGDPILSKIMGDPTLRKMAARHLERSLFNGFKLMSPHVQDAIQQTDRLFPANLHGIRNPHHRDERAVVFHDRGQDRLVPGPISAGSEGSVGIPQDLTSPTARVSVHSHPYTGKHFHYEPSMSDQIMARLHPDVEHIVQTPALRGENQYFTFSGAVPPRYYRLLPNPDNRPVPPNSPDRGMPAFRERPANGVQEGIPFSELPGNS